MNQPDPTVAEQIAAVVGQYQLQATGRRPRAISVVLSEDTLVITLHDALSPAEQTLASTPAGAVQVQEFHRQLFASSSATLREEILRITGQQVREAVAEVEPSTGSIVDAFTTGTVVQVFTLSSRQPATAETAVPNSP